LAAATLGKDAQTTAAPSQRITDADRQTMLEKNEYFYVCGLVSYTDIFGASQWSEFCAFLEPRSFARWFEEASQRRGEKIAVSFKLAPFGNDASFRPGGNNKPIEQLP
jgi:hypothetical protein